MCLNDNLPAGGRSQVTGAAKEAEKPSAPKVFPTVVTPAAAPTVVAPSPGVSDGVARMTFTTGSKVASGFTPQKDEEEEARADNGAAVEQVKRDLSDRLAGLGDKQNGVASSDVILSTPKKGRLEGGEDSAMSTPKTTAK